MGAQPWADGMKWVTAKENTWHMGEVRRHRAGEGALLAGNFQGRSLDWRLERWETGWRVSLRSCGTAEPGPVMTDRPGFADSCKPANPRLMPGPSTMDAIWLSVVLRIHLEL